MYRAPSNSSPNKPHLLLWQLDSFPMLSDWPPTQLGHWSASHSLLQTLVCFSYPSLLDTLNSPCLHFNPWPSSLTSVLRTRLSDSVSDSYIVADMVGTPQLDLRGLPLCQCVTSVQLAPVLENLCIRVASSQCHPHNGPTWCFVFEVDFIMLFKHNYSCLIQNSKPITPCV